MISPLQARGLRDAAPRASDSRQALVIFAVRAYDFWSHWFFVAGSAPCDKETLFESLAFRLRPIAMTDGDDASIWATISRLDATASRSQCPAYRQRYEDWLSISDEQLREFWVPDVPWSPDPPTGSVPAGWNVRPQPLRELWDRVYGTGPHSDFQRVLRTKIVDWGEGASLGADWHMARMLAMMSAIRPLVLDLYETVRCEITRDPAIDSP